MSASISQPIAGEAIEASRFGRFTVLKEAGAGAMGVVYAAYDPNLDRRVALKVLRGRATAGARRDAVRREALALARVAHPNVVPIYEVAESDGRLFLAMEYVDGPSLSTWLAAEAPPWTRIVALFAELADGLAAAHAQGLIHRDFKPDNVLVGADGRPRIIDFGLARALDDEGDVDPSGDGAHSGEFARLSVALSRTGRLKGTPAYMAPEQLDGEAPTAASDQFGFCVALFEALAGEAPFPRDSLPMLRSAIARGQIVAAPRVPADVIALVRRGLAADPGARWPSMAALGDVLRAALAEWAQFAREWRPRLVVGAVIGLFALGALGALCGDFPRTPRDFLLISGLVSLMLCVVAWVVLRWLPATHGNQRLGRFTIGFLIVKQCAALLGYRLGMGVEQLFACDLLVTVGFLWPASWYLHVDLTRALLASAPLLGAAFAHPPATPFVHSLVMLVFLVAFLRADWRRARGEVISAVGAD